MQRNSDGQHSSNMRPLAVVGNVNVDLIMGPTEPWPTPGTEVLVSHDELRAGGAAGNVALAWAALDVTFTIAANVGDDLFGHWLKQSFAPQSMAWPVESSTTTISVGLTHPDDERTFFSSRGHVPILSWQDVETQLRKCPLEGGILLVCGCFLTDSLTSHYTELFAWAEARRIDIAIDPGWPVAGWTDGQRSIAKGWLAHSRHILVNEIEALAITETADTSEALKALQLLMPPDGTAIVKAGARGAYAIGSAGECHAPAPTVKVIDTIGAGDVFNAGYLLATAQGAPVAAAVRAGVTLATVAVSTAPRRYVLADASQETT